MGGSKRQVESRTSLRFQCPGHGGQKQEVSAFGISTMREITAAESSEADSVPDMNPTCSSLKARMKWLLAS